MEMISLETEIFRGFLTALHKGFGTHPVLMQTDDVYRVEEYLQKTQGEQVSYPLLFITLTAMEVSTDRQGAKQLARQGVYSTVKGGKSVYSLPLIPVDYWFHLRLITQDYGTVFETIRKLLFSSVGRAPTFFNYTLTYMGCQIGIKVMHEGHTTFPQRENQVQAINTYQVESEFRLLGYVLDTDYVKEVPIVTNIQHTVNTGG